MNPIETIYLYIYLDIRGINFHVLMIILHPVPLWGFMVLQTEVFCDSILVIFNECFNEPYTTSIAEQSTSGGCR